MVLQCLTHVEAKLALMSAEELWTAEQLEKLSPAERDEIIRAGIVTDLAQVPDNFLKRVQANVAGHIDSTERAATSDR